MPIDVGGGGGSKPWKRKTIAPVYPKPEKKKPPKPRPVIKLFSPSQEQANAKTLAALKGIVANLKKANEMFRGTKVMPRPKPKTIRYDVRFKKKRP